MTTHKQSERAKLLESSARVIQDHATSNKSGRLESTTTKHSLVKNISCLPNVLYLYTDGSLVRRNMFTRAGAAAVGYHRGDEVFHHQSGLGGQAESFDGEMAVDDRCEESSRVHKCPPGSQPYLYLRRLHLGNSCNSRTQTQSSPTLCRRLPREDS